VFCRYQAIADKVKAAGSLLSVASYTVLEIEPPPLSLRLSVSAAHTDKQIDACIAALQQALKAT